MQLDLPTRWPPEYPAHVPISAKQAGTLDRRAASDFGVPSLILMEHAARGVASIAARLAPADRTIVVLSGPGNNGGDGYGVARFLHDCGRPVALLRCAPSEPAGGDAGHEFILASSSLPVQDAWEAPKRVQRALEGPVGLIVDALFGVGLSRPLAPPYTDWIEAVNASPVACLAIDVPSGMDADSGAPTPVCVRAHVTATMAAPKLGFAANPAATGRVVEIDIGLPGALLRPYLAS